MTDIISFEDTNCVCCEQKGLEIKMKLVKKTPEVWECPRCKEEVQLPFLTERVFMALAPLHWQGIIKDVKMVRCAYCHSKFMAFNESDIKNPVCSDCFDQMAYYPSGVY